MSSLSVSVAMATYNGEAYLSEQLESLAQQHDPIDQLVISDDCSTDSTVHICRSFAARVSFPVIILENQEQAGYSTNFFRAVSRCDGDIVMFCDQDDWWYPQKTNVIQTLFHDEPERLLVIHDIEFCNADLDPLGYTKLQRMRSFSNPYFTYVTGMATAIRRELATLSVPLPPDNGVSYDAWVHRLAIAQRSKRVIKDVLSRYRRHGDNATAGNPMNEGSVNMRQSFFASQAGRSPLATIRSQEFSWKCVGERLAERDLSVRSETKRALDRASRFRKWARWRAYVRGKNLVLKAPLVLLTLLVGGYRQFSGVFSASKDLTQRDRIL